jgi:uncharacterized protein
MVVCIAPATAGPLHDAARSGDLAAVVRLLDSGASIEDRDGTKETPLISASLAGNAEIVVELLKRGVDVMARNDRGLTSLHASSFGGDLEIVQALVEAGAVINDADDKFGVTPLILAAEENHGDIVEFLLDHGADLNQPERHGYTPLSKAVFKESRDTIAVLFKRGGGCQEEKKLGPIWFAACSKWKAELAP